AKEIADAGISPDVWVLHDPQTLPLASLLPAGSEIIWVCHIDTTVPNQQVIDQLRPLMREAKQLVFSLPQYVVPGLEDKRIHIIPPAIDPLITKNVEATAEGIRAAFIRMGLDPDRPIMSQVSRFDLWKDPWGVIDAYRTVKKEMPAVQLAMLGVIEAKDDPEAFDVLENIHDYAAGDPDIHLYSDPALVGQLEVGAIQTGADVVIQKSIREGFGLTVTESMWKGRPVIGGNVGGIRIQIEDGANGYLVDSSEACAQRMFDMLNNPERTREMGVAARQSVRENFLTPRLMGDYLSAIQEAVGGKVPAGTGDAAAFQPAMTPDFVPGDD
ncbi:MAG: glycosyltransferase, partial [Chloroflexi bacterium]|nr:glycosyltransferase [Chloroflexota bacterium]